MCKITYAIETPIVERMDSMDSMHEQRMQRRLDYWITELGNTEEIAHHVVIETQYRSDIATAVAVIRCRPYLHIKKQERKKHHQAELYFQISSIRGSTLTVTRPLSWNMYLRPSCTSWCARHTKSSLLIWLNCTRSQDQNSTAVNFNLLVSYSSESTIQEEIYVPQW